MLDYTKTILHKVSFSPALFGKELRKSLKWLKKEEILALQVWCIMTFGDIYPEAIRQAFSNIQF